MVFTSNVLFPQQKFYEEKQVSCLLWERNTFARECKREHKMNANEHENIHLFSLCHISFPLPWFHNNPIIVNTWSVGIYKLLTNQQHFPMCHSLFRLSCVRLCFYIHLVSKVSVTQKLHMLNKLLSNIVASWPLYGGTRSLTGNCSLKASFGLIQT